MSFEDAKLERQISDELSACEKARNEGRREDAHRHWEKFVSLIGKRTPARVKQMERQKGLA